MRKISMLVFLSLFTVVFAEVASQEESCSFRVREKKYTFSDEFEMDSEGKAFGTVIKSKLKFPGRTVYNLISSKGEYEGRGITNLWCFGVIWNWATEIYVYDAEDPEQLVGWIDGQFITTEGGKFSFYDAYGKRVGIAYLDDEDSSFSMKHPKNAYYTLAEFNRQFIQDVIDPWDVNLYEPGQVDIRLVKVFAAFVVDRQNHFGKIDR